MRRSTFTLLALAILAIVDMRPGITEVYRIWCAEYGGFVNCGFHSYEQCRMTASGTNTFCVQNQWYLQYGPGREGPQPGRRFRSR
jgi:hypothetical protein